MAKVSQPVNCSVPILSIKFCFIIFEGPSLNAWIVQVQLLITEKTCIMIWLNKQFSDTTAICLVVHAKTFNQTISGLFRCHAVFYIGPSNSRTSKQDGSDKCLYTFDSYRRSIMLCVWRFNGHRGKPVLAFRIQDLMVSGKVPNLPHPSPSFLSSQERRK